MANNLEFDFNLDADTRQKAERKYLVTCINVPTEGEDGAKVDNYQVVGFGVEDSTIEFNPETETVTDILGITETTVNKFEMSQDLDPMTVRGGSALAKRLHDIHFRKAMSEFAAFDVLLIYAYITKEVDGGVAYFAEKHRNCTVTPQSIGGSAYVDMPINISLSNDKLIGYTKGYKHDEEIVFTEDTWKTV